MTTVPLGVVSISDEQESLILQVLRNHRLSYGPMTRRLEATIAEIHGVDHAVFMASGTCALQVALEAAKEQYGWPDGAEVIIPATTFIATMSSVIHAGLTPVLCDVEWDRLAISPGQIDQHVTKRTVAVVVVHLLGRAAQMSGIMEEAARLNLAVFEDCCEAVGVQYGDKPVGSFGMAGAISSYVCHHFSTGVGGSVLTSDAKLATLCRSLMQHGRDPSYLCPDDDDNLNDAQSAAIVRARYSFERWGHSYRSTELEAALGVGCLQAPVSAAVIARERRDVAARIYEAFKPWPDSIAPAEFDSGSSPLFYPLIVRNRELCDSMVQAFEKAGIETRPLMPLLTQQIVLEYLRKQGKNAAEFPVAFDLCKRAFLIGCHREIGEQEVELIRDTAQTVLKRSGLVHRIYVKEADAPLWSEAWCAESAATEQFKMASKDLADWLAGGQHPAFDAYAELLNRCELNDNVGVLEVGCGAGYYQSVTQCILPSSAFMGVDVSGAMIATAKREFPSGIFSIAKAEQLPFRDGAFDVVVLGSVIGCCDDWQVAIRESFRVSRRYVMLHRAAVHDFRGADDIRTSVKTAYGVQMAERIIRESVVLDFAEQFGVRVGSSVLWSKSSDGFQGSYLFEVK